MLRVYDPVTPPRTDGPLSLPLINELAYEFLRFVQTQPHVSPAVYQTFRSVVDTFTKFTEVFMQNHPVIEVWWNQCQPGAPADLRFSLREAEDWFHLSRPPGGDNNSPKPTGAA